MSFSVRRVRARHHNGKCLTPTATAEVTGVARRRREGKVPLVGDTDGASVFRRFVNSRRRRGRPVWLGTKHVSVRACVYSCVSVCYPT